MPLDTDFIRFSREMKPTEQCKISQKIYGRTRGGGRSTAPLKYATGSADKCLARCLYSDGVIQPVTFGYLIYWLVLVVMLFDRHRRSRVATACASISALLCFAFMWIFIHHVWISLYCVLLYILCNSVLSCLSSVIISYLFDWHNST